ncbi:MAG: U32 family peptidase [Oscillospiraceae bacterium]|nr:U32 family peptidase [Oscillospiraceae bacterium]
MEILAPAGGPEQLTAAVRAGADAVYLGMGAFNARRGAANFDAEGLKKAVAYCHGRGVKVHVTVNTLVTDRELGALYRLIRDIGDSGADAVIVQDLAVAAMFGKHLPDMPLHASTQMSIHNISGVRTAEELGFSRVVLARELSLKEIEAIAAGTDAELEVFVHGALCVSVSGQCGLSSVLGGRSGNRGLCAQPCRLDFRCGKKDYALSLKDMSYIGRVKELENAGVCSLKIEGRMKRPEYVAAAVDACVKALDGERPDTELLENVFSRSGFTDAYLTGDMKDMFGRRTREDAERSAKALGRAAGLYRRERMSVPVDMRLELSAGKAVRLTVSDGINSAEVCGEIPEKVTANELRPEEALSKTGGTPFRLRELTADIEKGYTAKLNPLRKQALEKLLELREEIKPLSFRGSFEEPERKLRRTVPAIRLRFEKAEQIFDCPEAELICLPVEEIKEEHISRLGGRLAAELPRFCPPPDEPELRDRLLKLKEKGLERICAENLAHVKTGAELGFKVSGGLGLNILNGAALEQYRRMGADDAVLSYEIAMKDAVRMPGEAKRGLAAYGHLPLMLYRSCPVRAALGCAECGGRGKITDRMGTEFTVLCHGKKYSSLLNPVPLYIGDKDLSGVDFALMYFTTESAEECERAYSAFKRHERPGSERTNGLYYRELK